MIGGNAAELSPLAVFAKSSATAAHEKRRNDLDGAVKQSPKDCLKEALPNF